MEKFRQKYIREATALVVGGLILAGCSTAEGSMPSLDVSNKALYWPPEDCTIEAANQKTQKEKEHNTKTKYDRVSTANGSSRDKNPVNDNILKLDAENIAATYTQLHELDYLVGSTQLLKGDFTVEVKSDSQDLMVDEDALEEIFLLPLEYAEHIKDDGLRHQMMCYEEALNLGYVADSTTIYAPSDPDLCFTESQEIVSTKECSNRKEQGELTYGGITLPQLFDYQSDFITLTHQPPIVVLGLSESCEKATEKINNTLLHEVMHYWQWTFDAPLRDWKAIEQYAYSASDEIKHILELKGQNVPRAIQFEGESCSNN